MADNYDDEDICPLDMSGPSSPRVLEGEGVTSPLDAVGARTGSAASSTQEITSSSSEASSSAGSTIFSGPFGETKAEASTSVAENDTPTTQQRRPSAWTQIPTAGQFKSIVTYSDQKDESPSETKEKPDRRSWRLASFVPGQHPGNFSELNPGRHHSAGSRSRNASVAHAALRRASHVVFDPINPLREIGNPLELQINETRRVSSAIFPKRDDFDGRKPPSVGHLARKPSLFPVDIPEIEDVKRADDDPEDYIIQRLANHDDVDHMPNWKRYVYMTSPFWAIITLASYFAYLAMRIVAVIASQRSSNKIFGLAWTFIVVEFGVAIPMVMHRTWSMLMVRGRRRPKLRLLGNEVPSVDVIITCCGEDDDLTFNTALAACNIDYPADRFRVMILDDGASAGLKALVEDPRKHTFDNMYYFSRPKYPGVPHHFKAGNLNYALEQTKLMKGGAANFMAALDADMIPTKDWLRGLLPHMLQDTECSMACPPQQFYNVPIDDPLCQSLDTFIHISEPIKDALGVAWCTGSGYVMRRDALDSIGNFPLGSLAEDVCTSSMLLGAGWNTVFVHEPLQFGTVPDSLTGHLKQRTRWTIGTVQTSLKLRFCLYGPLVKHMSIMQKASGFVYTISSLFTIFLVLSLFTVPIVLYEGGTMVPYTTKAQLVLLIRLNFITMVANRINEWVTYLPCGYFVGQRDARGMLWMAPYHAWSVIQSFILPQWLGGKIAAFTSSGSQSSALNERDEKLRAPLLRRLKVTLIDCKAWLHLVYIGFVIGSVTLSVYRIIVSEKNKYPDPSRNVSSTESYLLDALTHAGWPPVLWLVCVVSCWSPIQYAISPPTVPDVDVLLEREERKDGGLGPAYPTPDSIKIKQSKIHILHEVQYSMLCAYQALVFAWSFYFLKEATVSN